MKRTSKHAVRENPNAGAQPEQFPEQLIKAPLPYHDFRSPGATLL